MFEFLTKKNNVAEKAADIEVVAEKPKTPEYVPEHAKKIGEFIVKEAMLKEQYDKGLSILKQSGINEIFQELSNTYQLVAPNEIDEKNVPQSIVTNTNPSEYYLYYSIWKDHKGTKFERPPYVSFRFNQEKINDYTAVYREIRAEVDNNDLCLINGSNGEIKTILDCNNKVEMKEIILESMKNPIIGDKRLQFTQLTTIDNKGQQFSKVE